MKKNIARALAPLALVSALVVVPASVASATDYSVDMNQACQIDHGAGWVSLLLNPSDAYSWRCWVPPWGVRKGVEVQKYCTALGLGTAVVLDPGNAYSWRCRT